MQELLISESECVRNRLAGLSWEGGYSTPRPLSWIYGEDRERRGNRKGREREKDKGEREGNGRGDVKRGKRE